VSVWIARLRGETEEPPREKEFSQNICFESDEVTVTGRSSNQQVTMNVLRKGGLRNRVSCTYRTEQLTAVPGYDFVEAEGAIEFARDSTCQSITIEILPKRASAVGRVFLVILESTHPLCDFHPDSDGPEDQCVLTVTVEASTSQTSIIDAVANTNNLRFALEDWKDQFVSACYCNGSAEESKEASPKDWFMHVLALPWKLLFAFVPSPGFFGGWLAFVVAISFIGLLTAVLSDLAEMFGCVLDVPDIVTATTFVALGTSVPDLFASISAAVNDETADASIVNVTGSNSVNVFLGLGLPWTIAAFYWSFTDRDLDWEQRYPEIANDNRYSGKAVFVVESDNLGFSVMVFVILSCIAILLLVMRRKYLGAELGGPTVCKVASGGLLAWLWVAYVALTSWRVLRCKSETPASWCADSPQDLFASIQEQGLVMGGVFIASFLVSLPTLISTKYYAGQAKEEADERVSSFYSDEKKHVDKKDVDAREFDPDIKETPVGFEAGDFQKNTNDTAPAVSSEAMEEESIAEI
jgi:Ca2+/Na+ antiporter